MLSLPWLVRGEKSFEKVYVSKWHQKQVAHKINRLHEYKQIWTINHFLIASQCIRGHSTTTFYPILTTYPLDNCGHFAYYLLTLYSRDQTWTFYWPTLFCPRSWMTPNNVKRIVIYNVWKNMDHLLFLLCNSIVFIKRITFKTSLCHNCFWWKY